MNDRIMQGGCLCGSVRYETEGKSLQVVNCHCSMCRRHSGAAFLTYVGYRSDSVRFLKGSMTTFHSSDQADRSHCAACGSPLMFVFHCAPEAVWLTVGSFDDPNMFEPTEHWYVASKLDWVHLDDGLPQWVGAPG